MEPGRDRIVLGLHVTPRPQSGVWRFVIGGLIVGYGGVLLAQNLGVHLAFVERSWVPFSICVLGLVKLFTSCTPAGRVVGGVVATAAGAWTFASVTGTHVDAGFWWPIILMGVGAMFLLRGREHEPEPVVTGAPGAGAAPGVTGTSSSASAVAVWSGVRRRITSAAFSRADLVAVMGGIEIDLRPSTTAGGRAVIDVFALMGGIEITVPPDWAVVNQAIVLMGGVTDRSTGAQGAANTLVIRGVVMMGGVEIKT